MESFNRFFANLALVIQKKDGKKNAKIFLIKSNSFKERMSFGFRKAPNTLSDGRK